MNFSVDFVFNFLNLAVRIGLVVFVIKRYVIANIAQSIFQEKEDLFYLKKQHKELEQSCDIILSQIQHDEKAFAALRLKFERWHQQVDSQETQEKIVCTQRQQKIEQAIVQKMKYVHHRKLIETQVPNVLANVTQTLQKKFQEDKNLGKKYQTQLLDALGKLN